MICYSIKRLLIFIYTLSLNENLVSKISNFRGHFCDEIIK